MRVEPMIGLTDSSGNNEASNSNDSSEDSDKDDGYLNGDDMVEMDKMMMEGVGTSDEGGHIDSIAESYDVKKQLIEAEGKELEKLKAAAAAAEAQRRQETRK